MIAVMIVGSILVNVMFGKGNTEGGQVVLGRLFTPLSSLYASLVSLLFMLIQLA